MSARKRYDWIDQISSLFRCLVSSGGNSKAVHGVAKCNGRLLASASAETRNPEDPWRWKPRQPRCTISSLLSEKSRAFAQQIPVCICMSAGGSAKDRTKAQTHHIIPSNRTTDKPNVIHLAATARHLVRNKIP